MVVDVGAVVAHGARPAARSPPPFQVPSAWGFRGGSDGKASACSVETRVPSLGWADPLEKEMATHSSSLAWKIPWTEEPGRLQSMGSQRVGQDRTTSLHS